MVNTTIDQNPLDPNYEKRRSSLGSMEDQNKAQSGSSDQNIMVDREVAPSSRAMCSDLSQQHASEDLKKHTERRSSQEVDHLSTVNYKSTPNNSESN
ncbi:uncharacterized protein N7479_006007 [Penicillium vulpinum]|uniref:uncharacterized protein n=1 Tax=Penicillium vulpinum TaxID=29845 RepID=UPI0025493F0D|nr:uncharacterized protein N7479_006007 [Penicillium vulpinum]KAJ5958857.1 hypothetical protein N7479_006007 [Penicillium vulpinum]